MGSTFLVKTSESAQPGFTADYTSRWLAVPRSVVKFFCGKLFGISVSCSRSVELMLKKEAIECFSILLTDNGSALEQRTEPILSRNFD